MTFAQALFPWWGLLCCFTAVAQPDTLLLAADEHYIMGDAGTDPSPELERYNRFNPAVGGDSTRRCDGLPCTGWIEDRYPHGQLKHRGYYDNGQLVLYRNYHPNGQMERDFKRLDDVRGTERTWHANGQPRSTARYVDGQVQHYQDHYVNGAVRYVEERERNAGCYTRMELFDAQGLPISSMKQINKGKGLLELSEYHPGGALKSRGHACCDRGSLETMRIGTWVYFDAAGNKVREEDYIDGKVHAVR